MEVLIENLKRIWKTTRIPIRYFERKSGTVLCTFGYSQGEDLLSIDEKLFDMIFSIPIDRTIPFIYIKSDTCLFGAFEDGLKGYCVLGPMAHEQMPMVKHIQRNLHTKVPNTPPLPDSNYDYMCSVLSLVYFLLRRSSVSEVSIAQNATTQPYVDDHLLMEYNLDNTENKEEHYSYADEIRFIDDIKYGRVDHIQKRIQVSDMNSLKKVGRFSNNNNKQMEYLACSVFTKSSMAAIEGGLPPITAYALSDIAKQKLEQCSTTSDMLRLMIQIMIDFARRVSEYHNEKTGIYYIEKCKVYIVNHLNEDFHLDDIAQETGISKDYLSRRFSQLCGIGIRKYTLNKRLNAAANMLKYSDVRIRDISNYLRFASQSYFGKVFKESYGITPKVYRDREKLVDFLSPS